MGPASGSGFKMGQLYASCVFLLLLQISIGALGARLGSGLNWPQG